MTKPFNPYDLNDVAKVNKGEMGGFEKIIKGGREMTSKSMQKRINIQQGKPMITTQQETQGYLGMDNKDVRCEVIEWHHYPEEKPQVTGTVCLVTYKYQERICVSSSCFYREKFWFEGTNCEDEIDGVIAWAEMPVGWKE